MSGIFTLWGGAVPTLSHTCSLLDLDAGMCTGLYNCRLSHTLEEPHFIESDIALGAAGGTIALREWLNNLTITWYRGSTMFET